MLRFLLAYLGVFAVLAAWVVAAWPEYAASEGLPQFMLAGLIAGLPVGVAWAAMSVFERARPCRVFDARVKTVWLPVGLGVASALLSVAATVVLVSFLDEFVNDAVSLAAGAVIGTGAVMLCLGREKPGLCINCGYDLSGAAHARCSECGCVQHGVTASAAQWASCGPHQTQRS